MAKSNTFAGRTSNSANRLFGGTILGWIDEEAFIFAKCQLKTPRLVTRHMSEVNFISPAKQDDIVEFGLDVVSFGRTSISVKCQARNKDSGKIIVEIEKIVLIAVNQNGDPVAHGVTERQED